MNPSARALLARLGLNGPTHRSDLAAATGLSKAAVSTLARSLIDAGVVHEVATTRSASGQGRPSVLLDLAPKYGFLVGVKLDEDPLVLVLTDLKGGIVAQDVRPLAPAPANAHGRKGSHATATERGTAPDPGDVARSIADGVHHLLVSSGTDPRRLLGVGIAVSGIVGDDGDVVRHSAILGWDDVPLGGHVERLLGVPVLVENDANAVATFEHLYGSARGTDDFALVTIGRGVGAAQFVAGRLQRGNDGGAGELAHCTVVPEGRQCACGKRGCLDTVAARGAIVRAAREQGLEVDGLAALEALAQRGDTVALSVLRDAATHLGLGVSHLIHIADPGLVVIAGVRFGPGTIFATAIRHALERHLLPRRLPTLNLAFRSLEALSWAQGAAALATHSLLTGRLHLPP